MKDLPHHINKLNRRVLRSLNKEEAAKLPEVPTFPETLSARKKKAKIHMRDQTRAHVSSALTEEERNKLMKGGRKGRVPVFDQNKGTMKRTLSSKKKTPRI